jgi:transcriptional regulator NrdR family protein
LKAGLPCPRCASVTLRTLDTRKAAETIRRRRECHHCGAQFYTVESIQTEEVAKCS